MHTGVHVHTRPVSDLINIVSLAVALRNYCTQLGAVSSRLVGATLTDGGGLPMLDFLGAR